MNISRRKLGTKWYNYLKHSFRKNGEVYTKEKYLGKQIPEDIEEIKKLFLEECKKAVLFKQFYSIKKNFQKEWKIYPKSIKDKTKKQLAINFTYNTNAIEGSTINLKETQELIEKNIAPHKSLNDIKESERHAKLFLRLLEKNEDFTIRDLLYWHELLFKETKPDIAGKLRDYLICVGSYIAPDWQDVKKLMQDLIKYYHNNSTMHPVELSARIHYKFEKIHPFGNGNGRVGRILMNYILSKNNYPVLIIEYSKRKSYYNALEKNEEKFVNYFSRRYLSVHKRYLNS